MLELLEVDARFGCERAEAAAQLLDELRRLIRARGVDDELPVVRGLRLWVDVVIEAGRSGADEGGVDEHTMRAGQLALELAHRGIGGLDTRTLRKPHVDHELVALGEGKVLLWNLVEEEDGDDKACGADRDRRPLAGQRPGHRALVDGLHRVQRTNGAEPRRQTRRLRRRLGVIGEVRSQTGLDERQAEHRRQKHRDGVRREQCNGDGDRQRPHELARGSGQQNRERHERRNDGERRREHRDGEIAGALPCRLTPRDTMIELLHIIVGDDDRVVDDHAQRDDETGEGDLMELHPDRREHCQRDRDGDGNRNRRDRRHAEGEEQDGHENDRYNRDRELVAEVIDTLLHHRRLIGNEIDLEIGRERRAQLGDRMLNGLAEGDDVLPVLHLDRHEHGVAAVDAHEKRRILETALHGREVAEPHRLARGAAADEHPAQISFGGE